MWLRLFSVQVYLAVDRFWRRCTRLIFFWRAARGAETFLERYRADHVLAITADERAAAPSYEKCVLCSLCTFSCTAIRNASAPPGFEPKLLVGVFGKHTHESEVFLEDWYPCAKCDACTVICPNEVPIHAIVAQVTQRRQKLGFRRGTQRA